LRIQVPPSSALCRPILCASASLRENIPVRKQPPSPSQTHYYKKTPCSPPLGLSVPLSSDLRHLTSDSRPPPLFPYYANHPNHPAAGVIPSMQIILFIQIIPFMQIIQSRRDHPNHPCPRALILFMRIIPLKAFIPREANHPIFMLFAPSALGAVESFL